MDEDAGRYISLRFRGDAPRLPVGRQLGGEALTCHPQQLIVLTVLDAQPSRILHHLCVAAAERVSSEGVREAAGRDDALRHNGTRCAMAGYRGSLSLCVSQAPHASLSLSLLSHVSL